VPRLSVIAPFTKPQLLRVGPLVRAIGVIVPPMLSLELFGLPASEVVDRVLSLEDLWSRPVIQQLGDRVSNHDLRVATAALSDACLMRIGVAPNVDPVGRTAPRIIHDLGGLVSIRAIAERHGLGRQQFAQRFQGATGLSPKLFARITRFQRLVRSLLTTDVERWPSLPGVTGFYDQAHMINEFRVFAGSSPTSFFRPHDNIERPTTRLHGRPSEWRK
jgi:AraC-like DNA-binding protein